ncbi:hypothetical protein EV127DRAFT_133585 [Xylaria flabelliformis]|nr:hypothetical protein EV127DRAFT_133585 [Xylaria flabelliformis]
MRYSIFPAFVGLAAALPGQVVEKQISISTVTAAAHPMTFWPLSPLDTTATPLSYGSPPTPSRVPPPQLNEEVILNADCTSTLSPPLRSSPAPTTTTSICTIIKGSYPTSTLPSFCRPTLFANAPNRPSPSPAAAAAVVTIGANSVPDKISCCAECAAYYNCFAWRFVPAYVEQTPTPMLPGGFDPWRHGGCEIAYHTGDREEEDGEDVPSLCPNGLVTGWNGTDGGMGERGKADAPWFDGLYYNGWNEGACSSLGDVVFLGGGDLGIGDESSLCHD